MIKSCATYHRDSRFGLQGRAMARTLKTSSIVLSRSECSSLFKTGHTKSMSYSGRYSSSPFKIDDM